MSGNALPRWVPWAACALSIAAFAATPTFGFVYDDHRFVAGNAALGEPSVLWRAFVDPAVQTADGTHAGLWRPLRTLSFALDRLLFGASAAGPHAVNVALHGLGVFLVARLLARWGAGSAGVLLGALAYGLHPVQIESVAWISSRGDLLAAALVWAALLVPGTRASLALGAAALLAKEQAVAWPLLASAGAILAGRSLGDALRAARGPGVVTLAFLGVRYALLAEPFQEGGLAAGAPGAGETIGMLAHQTARLVVPVGSLFDWQMPWPPGGALPRLAITAAGLLPLALLVPQRTRALALWFLAALAPTLFVQWVVPLNIRVADRFLLFALPALACGVACGVTLAPRALPAAGVAVLALAGATATALPQWASEQQLWTHVVVAEPGHWRARSWLGADALRRGDAQAAVDHLRLAADAAPTDAKTHFLLGQAYQGLAPRAAGTDGGDRVVELTVLARAAYGRAVGLWTATPPVARQEGGGGLVHVARIRGIDLTLALGERGSAARLLRGLLAAGRPDVPGELHAVWARDVLLLAAHVEEHGLGPDGRAAETAATLRAWAEARP